MFELGSQRDSIQEERRRVRRHHVLMVGQIVLGDDGAMLDCAVRNFTAAGACLRLASAVALPSRFGLVIRGVNKAVPCELAWQHGTNAGVQFMLGSSSRTLGTASKKDADPNAGITTPLDHFAQETKSAA